MAALQGDAPPADATAAAAAPKSSGFGKKGAKSAAAEREARKNDVGRQLKIKLGMCRRLAKEVAFYLKEARDNEAIVERLTAEGKDQWELSQPLKCVEEVSRDRRYPHPRAPSPLTPPLP